MRDRDVVETLGDIEQTANRLVVLLVEDRNYWGALAVGILGGICGNAAAELRSKQKWDAAGRGCYRRA